MEYTIGQVAKQLGLSTPTLRYYEDEGLLSGVRRTEGGRRVYTESDLEALRVIECLKHTGLSIKEISDFVKMVSRGDESIPDRLELFRERRDQVKTQQAELAHMQEILVFKCWYYEKALELGSEAAVRALPNSKVPKRLREVRNYLGSFD
ncbi:MAG: MerR family transcriptional regulator [Eggerthellaceae bacterium]|nr:MerR family transcriptional regulator [Eggerthellaceae bacterium]